MLRKNYVTFMVALITVSRSLVSWHLFVWAVDHNVVHSFNFCVIDQSCIVLASEMLTEAK